MVLSANTMYVTLQVVDMTILYVRIFDTEFIMGKYSFEKVFFFVLVNF